MTSTARIMDDRELSNLVRGDWRVRKASSGLCDLGVICWWQGGRWVSANGTLGLQIAALAHRSANSICIRRKLEDQLVRAIRSGKVEGDGRVRRIGWNHVSNL
jgi:hypothetical protein